MPRGDKGRKTKGARTTHSSLRAVIVCMRVFYNESFDEIERKIGVKSSTAQAIWQRAHETADSEDFHDILACIEPKEMPGRPTKVIDGTLESAAIRTLLYEEKDKTFEQVLSLINVRLKDCLTKY